MNPASLTSPNRRDFVKIVGVGAMSLLAKGPTVMQAGEGMAGPGNARRPVAPAHRQGR